MDSTEEKVVIKKESSDEEEKDAINEPPTRAKMKEGK